VDIGGGTTKLALCQAGRVLDVAAVDVGARLIALDKSGNVTRIEDAARLVAKHLDIPLEMGKPLSSDQLRQMAGYLADRLFEVVQLGEVTPGAKELLRTPNIDFKGKVDALMFSGGVSEFIYGHQPYTFGDMGDVLGGQIRERAQATGLPLLEPVAGIRATVVGASQHTVQVSGNTIYLSSPGVVPVRNVPVARPHLGLSGDNVEAATITRAVKSAVDRLDLHPADRCVALAIEWQGSATFGRLDAISRGIMDAQAVQLAAGHPMVLVCDSDVGGLLGLHMREELGHEGGLVSIDGIELSEFDYIDIGALIPASGATPVVIKSLVFPHQGEKS
jgi:ethanolamine utilization protein EutA